MTWSKPWTCVTCKAKVYSFEECLNHMLDTSSHFNFDVEGSGKPLDARLILKAPTRIPNQADSENERFKELEKQGKAFHIDYLRVGGSENQPWNVVAQCRNCKKLYPQRIFFDGIISKLPDNAIGLNFKCDSCGWTGTLNPRDMMDYSELLEWTIQKLSEENAEYKTRLGALSSGKKTNPLYG